MRYKILITLALSLELNATTITTLLNSLERRPEARIDSLDVDKSSLGKDALHDKLMPVVSLYGGYEISNSPNGLIPVPPNTLIGMVQDKSVAQPFSKKIFREGVSFTWPIFIKSIYTLEEKAQLLHLASKDKKRLNFIQREALVVGSVAQLRYLKAMEKALLAKKRSILETQLTTKMKVKEGRVAPSAIFLLNSHINELDISLNSIKQNRNKLLSQIETLTGVRIGKTISLRKKKSLRKENIFALNPLQKRVEATQKGIKAAKDAYYPMVLIKGSYTLSQGDAYNNNKSLSEHFASGGVYLSMPLYDHSKETASQQAKVEYLKERVSLDETRDRLQVQAKQISQEIRLLDDSIRLASKSIADQKGLLAIAKFSLESKSITQEEYLRYEDALANAKAILYKSKAQRWQDIAQLAVIYGNDLRRIVK